MAESTNRLSILERLWRFLTETTLGSHHGTASTSSSSESSPEQTNTPETSIQSLKTVSEDQLDEAVRNVEAPVEEEIDDYEYWWQIDPVKYHYPIFDSIDVDSFRADIEKKIERGNFKMKNLPNHIFAIMKLLNNANFNYQQLSSLVSKSPVLTGEFIHLSNSALYSRGRKINDLRVALPRLGQEKIKLVLYMNSARSSLREHPLFDKVAGDIVEHSYAVAIIANYLSQRYYPDPDMATLAGLLHDIGKLAVLKELAEEFNVEDTGLVFGEESFDEIIQPVYAQVGYSLAQFWNLDKETTNTIRYTNNLHELMDSGYEDDVYLPALIQLSDYLACRLGKGRYIDEPNLFAQPGCIAMGIEDNKQNREFFEQVSSFAIAKIEESGVK
ncbi:MAG: HDOD domain-containing protein [Lentisphaeria bacterium]|nr:HDOD domain-containing protein [Lentisphaeria bacterium]NQZ70239.1 HDOD domain-containing protein [Lentisphaeria bacterium]